MSQTSKPPRLDIPSVRADFPILDIQVHGKPLVYLDNAATTQKPRAVIHRLTRFFEEENANIHRGVHYLSQQATDAYERARQRVAQAIGAAHQREVIFTRGTTEAINLVAASFLRAKLREGDEIVLTVMEHHANIVPWQLVAEERGARIRVAPMHDDGSLDLAALESLLSTRVKMLAVVHVSNVLGTINPIAEITALARARGIPTLVDGAQAMPHGPINVHALGCDFYAFSGHKLYAPDGIGVLWGRTEILESMPPYQGGGDMIERVRFEGTSFRGIPERFEAGTPNISSTIGLAAALDYLDGLGWEAIQAQEEDLLHYATVRLEEIPGLCIHGKAPGKRSVVAFSLADIHPHDIGTFLDAAGIAVRAGHHCAQPLADRLGLGSTTRASFAFYNTREEIDILVAAILEVRRFFAS